MSLLFFVSLLSELSLNITLLAIMVEYEYAVLPTKLKCSYCKQNSSEWDGMPYWHFLGHGMAWSWSAPNHVTTFFQQHPLFCRI